MKKRCIFLLILAVVLLCGCASQSMHPLSLDGYTLTVYPEECTITCDGEVYRYERVEPSIMENTVTVHYPNGASYTQKNQYSVVIVAPGAVSGSDSAETTQADGSYTGTVDESRYVPGKVLVKAVNRAIELEEDRKAENAQNGAYLAVAVVALAIGLAELLIPEKIWYLRHWWCVDGGQPSEFYLTTASISGWICVILGVLSLLAGIF